jgi:hypothetical protein
VSVVWLCHKSAKSLRLKNDLDYFCVSLETGKLFNFKDLASKLSLFMTQP